jgi:hypothetical protein
MLIGEHKAPYCTDGVVVDDGVDTSDNRPKETGVGGMAKGVIIVDSAAVDKDERETGTEDDRVVLDDED